MTGAVLVIPIMTFGPYFSHSRALSIELATLSLNLSTMS